MQRGATPQRLGRCAHWVACLGTAPDPMAPEEGARLRNLGPSGGGRRLAVSVPTDSDGPELLSTERFGVLFDGELHNGDQLERELEGAGPGGAELVLRAYRRWGALFYERLHGEYSLLLWDGDEDRFFAVRDRMGIFPLFLASVGEALWTSRSLAALAAEPAVPSDVDRGVMASHLAHSWPQPEETYVASIRRLPPAQALTDEGGRRTTRRYWDPVPRGDATALEPSSGEFEALFETAIARRWAPGATGIFLSGGLDSVSIAATGRDLARGNGGGPLALCLLFPDEHGASEESVQRGVTGQLELDSQMLTFDDALAGRNFFRAGLEWSAHLSHPICNHWWPVYGELGVLGRESGCDVILTGMGGDEWLGVSPHYSADLMRGGSLLRVLRLLRAELRSFRQPALRMAPRLLWDFGLKLVLRQALFSSMAWMSRTPGLRAGGRALTGLYRARSRRIGRRNVADWLAPDPELRRELLERFEQKVDAILAQDEDDYLVEMRRGLDHFLVSSQFEESFEVETQMGVRFRHPFLDAQLVEGLCRVAPEVLIEGGRSKAPLRDALEKRLPQLGFERQKKLLATDFWQGRCLAHGEEVWDELGGPTLLAEMGIIDLAAAERFKQRVFIERERTQAYLFWDLVNLETWARNWS